MKKTYRNLFLSALLAGGLLTTPTAQADVIIKDNLDSYTAGDLYNNGPWLRQNATVANPVQLVSGSLTYDGYADNATGMSATLGNTSGSQKLKMVFPEDKYFKEAAGTIYYSVLLNVKAYEDGDTAPKNAAIIAFMQLGFNLSNADGAVGTEFGKLFIKKGSANDKFILSVAQNGTKPTAYDTELNAETTYLVVVKYNTSDNSASLFVNPSNTATEPAANAINNLNASSFNSERGFAALTFNQAATATTSVPRIEFDDVRVATAWADLFESTTPTPPTPATPSIAVNPEFVEFENADAMMAGVGESYNGVVNVKAENLTEDITITLTADHDVDVNQVTLSATTIAAADAMSETGVDLTVTLTPTQEMGPITMTLASGETTKTVAIDWYAPLVHSASTVADLRALPITEGEFYLLNCEVTVSLVRPTTGMSYVYAEDATGGITVGLPENLPAVGDKLKLSVGSLISSMGSLSFEPLVGYEVVSSGNEVVPTVVTIAELKAEPKKYESRLLKIEEAEISSTEPTFSTSVRPTITQGSESVNMWILSGTDLVGEAVPATATVVGVSTSGNGMVIAPRSKADIIAVQKEASITVDPEFVEFENADAMMAGVGESYNGVVNVKAENLTEDITITLTADDDIDVSQVTLSATTIAAADAMSENGVDLTVTLTPTQEMGPITMTLASGETTKTVAIDWYALVVHSASTVAEFRNLPINEEHFYLLDCEVTVSLVRPITGEMSYIYAEDATAGITIGSYESVPAVGDKLKLSAGMLVSSMGSLSFEPFNGYEVVSSGNEVVPTVVTIAGLKAEPKKYESRLLKIEHAEISSTEPTFSTSVRPTVTQESETIEMWILPDNDLIGEAIPTTTATIVGVSTSGAGTIIAPRSKADISTGSGIEQGVATDIQVYAANGVIYVSGNGIENVELFNVSGCQVAACVAVGSKAVLEVPASGIYMVRVNGSSVHKVLVR